MIWNKLYLLIQIIKRKFITIIIALSITNINDIYNQRNLKWNQLVN